MSKHFADNGTQENVHKLEGDQLKQREVDMIDIAFDEVPEKEYEAECDPTKFHSEKTNRGPLTADWTVRIIHYYVRAVADALCRRPTRPS